LSALASKLATHPNKKVPHFVQDFFIRAQDWITFSDPNELVLPKAFPTPSAWAVVFPCSLLKASFQRSQ
jgi:hypothetical protein